MVKGQKKGLSAVVTAVLMILIVLFAVGIVWVVIKNLIIKQVEGIDLDRFTIDLEITRVVVGEDSVDVTVKRDPGKGNLSELKFLITDGLNSEVINISNPDLDELEKKTFSLDYDGVVKEVSVAPVFKTSSGEQSTGSILDTQKFSDDDIIDDLGLVSWWDFDGETAYARDRIDGNDGTLYNGVLLFDGGVYGKAAVFDGFNDYINVNDNENLRIGNEISLELWFKADLFETRHHYLFMKGDEYRLFRAVGGEFVFFYSGGSDNIGGFSPNTDQWYHVVASLDGNYINWYLDGELQETTPFTYTPTPSSSNLVIGSRGDLVNHWIGWIDEVRIYNKTLSERDVRFLYRGGLNK